MESVFPILFLAGLAIALVGFIGLVVVGFIVSPKWGIGILVFPPTGLFFASKHPRTARNPLLICLAGLLMAAFPPLYTRLMPVDLGPRIKIISGEQHVTLTGWDRKDYEILRRLPEVVVLQMANADVSDTTLESIKNLSLLRELDLNDSKVTDAGLKSLTGLSKLQRLRLRNTGVTDQGFTESLGPLESLKELDLRGTKVDKAVAKQWVESKPGRRVLQ